MPVNSSRLSKYVLVASHKLRFGYCLAGTREIVSTKATIAFDYICVVVEISYFNGINSSFENNSSNNYVFLMIKQT